MMPIWFCKAVRCAPAWSRNGGGEGAGGESLPAAWEAGRKAMGTQKEPPSQGDGESAREKELSAGEFREKVKGRGLSPNVNGESGSRGEAQAEEPNEGSAQGKAPSAEEGREGTDKKTFTQEELDTILGRKYAKWQKDAEARMAAARQEGEALARLSAREREEKEREEREAQLQQREQEITRRELRAMALETLAERGLPRELADTLDYAKEERMQKSLEAVEKAFRSAIHETVSQRLKGSAPKAGDRAGAEDAFGAIFGVDR